MGFLLNTNLWHSSKVFVELSVLFVSFQVVSLNQAFDSFLYHSRVWLELGHQDLGCLHDQLLVGESFSGLHDLHDDSFNHVLSVVVDSLLDFVGFLGSCFFRVDDWNFNFD